MRTGSPGARCWRVRDVDRAGLFWAWMRGPRYWSPYMTPRPARAICWPPSPRPRRRRRAARCRWVPSWSVRTACAGPGGQPHARAQRPHRARRDAGHPRGLRGAAVGAADRRRSLRHAGALPDVRDRHLVCAHPPALLRRRATPRAAASSTDPASSASPRATTRRRSTAGSRRRGPRGCCGRFSPAAVEGAPPFPAWPLAPIPACVLARDWR